MIIFVTTIIVIVLTTVPLSQWFLKYIRQNQRRKAIDLQKNNLYLSVQIHRFFWTKNKCCSTNKSIETPRTHFNKPCSKLLGDCLQSLKVQCSLYIGVIVPQESYSTVVYVY